MDQARARDDEDEDWLVDDQPASRAANGAARPWRVLVVDDEPDVHAVTRVALSSLRFKERGLELLAAHSAAEAAALLTRESDIALILLDVVMESDDAGLVLARRIREELDNHLVRIVLRTGQPGQAPEEKVIVEYDINDYKAKTELTKQKLFTTVIASLRAYEGLVSIHRHSVGLRKILDGAGNLYQLRSLREFACGVLNQIGAILDIGIDGILCLVRKDETAAHQVTDVVAATGVYAEAPARAELDREHRWSALVKRALAERRSLFTHPVDALYIRAENGSEFVIVMTPPLPLDELQCALLGVFCDRIAAAFDNLHMFDQLQKAQQATVIALADLAESRDTDTGGHVQRVCRLTDAIVGRLHRAGRLPGGLPENFLSQVGLASMLHDVGKVATPDAVLLKPGGHTPEERAIMEAHVEIGRKVLSHAARMVAGESYLTIGTQIAASHHEHYDGKGYPLGLAGDAIPFAGRVVAVIDVFDALLHSRPYKRPWPLQDVIDYLRQHRGSQFDPLVVDTLIEFVTEEQPDWLIGEGH